MISAVVEMCLWTTGCFIIYQALIQRDQNLGSRYKSTVSKVVCLLRKVYVL